MWSHAAASTLGARLRREETLIPPPPGYSASTRSSTPFTVAAKIFANARWPTWRPKMRHQAPQPRQYIVAGTCTCAPTPRVWRSIDRHTSMEEIHGRYTQWLTQAQYATCAACELGRAEIHRGRSHAHRCSPPEGDLRENGGYHAKARKRAVHDAHPGPPGDMLEHAEAGWPRRRRIVEPEWLSPPSSPARREQTFLLRARREATWAFRSSLQPLAAVIITRQATFRGPHWSQIDVEIIDAASKLACAQRARECGSHHQVGRVYVFEGE